MYADGAEPVALGRTVNAAGRAGTEVYGIAADPPQIVMWSAVPLTVLADAPDLAEAYTGTIRDGIWYLLIGRRLVTVPLDDLSARGGVSLSTPVTVGDWDFAGSSLVSISTLGGTATLVSVNPALGVVTVLGFPSGMPGDAFFAVRCRGPTRSAVLPGSAGSCGAARAEDLERSRRRVAVAAPH